MAGRKSKDRRWKPSDTIIVALIGAAATIIVAVLPLVFKDRTVIVVPETTATAVTSRPSPIPTINPTMPVPDLYTLQNGELPYCIAKRFNVDFLELLNLNNLNRPAAIGPGFTLKIPQDGKPYSGNRIDHAHPSTYIVESSSQTIYGIACYFGDVYPDAIALLNNLPINNPPLSAGQKLLIP